MSRGEKFNAISHLCGVLLTAAGLFVLVVPPLRDGEFTKAIAFTVYGTSLLLTFLASTLYHSVRGQARDLMRRADRIAIYLLIAGTYTPVTLVRLPASWGWPLLTVAWGLALYGSVLEWFDARHERRHTMSLYFVMSFISVFALRPLFVTVGAGGVAYLVAGGVFYTVGALAIRLTLHPRRHEFWHVAVLAGSACHFLMMLHYVR